MRSIKSRYAVGCLFFFGLGTPLSATPTCFGDGSLKAELLAESQSARDFIDLSEKL